MTEPTARPDTKALESLARLVMRSLDLLGMAKGTNNGQMLDDAYNILQVGFDDACRVIGGAPFAATGAGEPAGADATRFGEDYEANFRQFGAGAVPVRPEPTLDAVSEADLGGWVDKVRDLVFYLRVAARAKGYALGVHGTLRRDIDLVAVPWTEEACSAEELAQHLCDYLAQLDPPLMHSWQEQGEQHRKAEDKPLGRKSWALHTVGFASPYLDLSVAPRAAVPVREAGDDENRAPNPPTEGWVCRCYRYHALEERWCSHCNDEWHAVLERVRAARAGENGEVERDPQVADIAQRIYRQLIGASKDPEYAAIFARRDIDLLIAAVVRAARSPSSRGEPASAPAASPTLEVLFIRCLDHRTDPQINANEITGAECGTCAWLAGIAHGEQRERNRARMVAEGVVNAVAPSARSASRGASEPDLLPKRIRNGTDSLPPSEEGT